MQFLTGAAVLLFSLGVSLLGVVLSVNHAVYCLVVAVSVLNPPSGVIVTQHRLCVKATLGRLLTLLI